ncbi:hypoxanthine phosphoribosyltransferase [Fibrella aquatica]|uniref:hypoxanthine phosphoribosyltransferase n=1 Tax=Fibrella aquatica TaxID=3242487 RepID=UPI0035200F14
MLTVLDKTFVPFIGRDTLQNRISELADQINRDYAGRCPLVVGVLNGAVLFTADLLKNLTIDCEITFIRVASYEQTASTGKIKEILGLTEVITGRDLIVIEDIVDTGMTIAHVCQQLAEKNPASIAIATLLFKPTALKTPVDLAYVGFEIANEFVVGYGLDYDGLGRNTKDIFVLKES